MKKYFYCKKWSLNFKKARDPMNVEEAKKIHETLYGTSNQNVQGKFIEYTKKHRGGILQYTVIEGSLEKPTVFAQFVSNNIWVNFLDDNLRAYLEYVFSITEYGKLFLSQAVHRKFANNIDETLLEATIYYFEEDGSLVIDKGIYVNNERLGERATNTIDVSKNYEDFPIFEDYVQILKKER